MKKIAIVTNNSWYAWNMRLNLGFALQKQGYEVVFICPYDKYSENIKEHFKHFDVELNPKGTKPIEDLKQLQDKFDRVINRTKYIKDIVFRPGDILIMDQFYTLHRRSPILDQKRELWRVAIDYKNSLDKQKGIL